jgi:hypothetical protein
VHSSRNLPQASQAARDDDYGTPPFQLEVGHFLTRKAPLYAMFWLCIRARL